MLRLHLLKILWVCSLPLLILFLPQAIGVKRKTIRLPSASGPREQLLTHPSAQTAQPLMLLHYGESTVDGVGVADTRMGFTAQIATSLQPQINRSIRYVIRGQNGIKLKALVEQLPIQTQHWDVAIITMGVNDCKGLTPITQWRKQLEACISILQQQQSGPIFFTQVPPMAQFPALPAPLKYLLGLRSYVLNLVIQQVCQAHNNVYLLHGDLNIEPGMMAEDGFHPSEKGYKDWAKQITPSIAGIINKAKPNT